jgi:predicted nucleic-acid-binding Zn-ribbon protein
MKRNLACPCGRNFSIETEDEIDLDENTNSLENIFNRTFMSFSCPDCGKKHKPEYTVMLVWKSKNLKLEVLPELERGEFYRRKKENASFETVIGYPEMFDRMAVLKDGLEPVVIETLKYYLLAKAEENYPDRDINAWYNGKGPAGIEFHLAGIREDEVAVMRIPQEVYDKTSNDFKKQPKNEIFTTLRCRSYLSVQNMFRSDVLK